MELMIAASAAAIVLGLYGIERALRKIAARLERPTTIEPSELRLGPHDTLVLLTDENISHEDCEHIRTRAMSMLESDRVEVCVLAKGMRLQVLRREIAGGGNTDQGDGHANKNEVSLGQADAHLPHSQNSPRTRQVLGPLRMTIELPPVPRPTRALNQRLDRLLKRLQQRRPIRGKWIFLRHEPKRRDPQRSLWTRPRKLSF